LGTKVKESVWERHERIIRSLIEAGKKIEKEGLSK